MHCTCWLDSTSPTPLQSPFQPPVSFLPLKALSTKYPLREVRWFFNPLHHSQKTMHLISVAGHHRYWIAASLTQLSSHLFPLYFSPRLTVCPDQVGLSTYVRPFSVCCALSSLSPLLPSRFIDLLRQLGLPPLLHLL